MRQNEHEQRLIDQRSGKAVDSAASLRQPSLKEGDVYRWRYRDPGDDSPYGRYHCCSCIAIVTNGRLRDTYWSTNSEGRSFGVDDLSKLELTHLGNLDGLEKHPKYVADLYADTDIVDLTHPNGGDFFIRKGAKRSAAKMLETAIRRLHDAEEDERRAVERADRLRTIIAQIESGNTAVYFW